MCELYSLGDKIVKQNLVQAASSSKWKFYYEVMEYKKCKFQFISFRNKAQPKKENILAQMVSCIGVCNWLFIFQVDV